MEKETALVREFVSGPVEGSECGRVLSCPLVCLLCIRWQCLPISEEPAPEAFYSHSGLKKSDLFFSAKRGS